MKTTLVCLVTLLAACSEKAEVKVVSASQPATPPPVTNTVTFEKSVTDLCAKQVECAAQPELKAQLASDCARNYRALASDAFSRDVLIEATKEVMSKCGTASCDAFANCYMDAMKSAQAKLMGGAAPPAKTISADKKKTFIALVCAVSAESAGRVPALTGPEATPMARQLQQMVIEIGDAALISDLMKEAIATCE